MTIDISTLFILVVLLCSVVGSIMLWAGLNNGGVLPLYGGSGLFLVALGVTLILLRNILPDLLSIVVANAILTLGFGLLWSVARLFSGGRFSAVAVLAGPVIWIVACAIPDFYGNTGLRLFLLSVIAASYASASGWALWQGQGTIGQARRALIGLCYGHAVLVVCRGVYSLFLPPTARPLDGDWIQGLLMLEAPVALIAGCFLAVGMVREHAEGELRRTAETDALTGVLNRRALIELGGERVAQATRQKHPLVLLLFDLDHFKTINDRFGHAVGDRALRLFADTVGQAIRATDVFGRIGGEEFVAVLPGCDTAAGRQIAERIRADFSQRTAAELGAAATVTVSVGIAENSGDARDLESLMLKADEALYGSKRGGRDRVTSAATAAELMPVFGFMTAGHTT